MIQIAIIEDNNIYRENLSLYLSYKPETEICFKGSSYFDFNSYTFNQNPDIILLDIGLPGQSGLDSMASILKSFPKSNIIMLTSFEDEESIFTSLTRGASAYLSKRITLEKIYEAVLIVHRGGSFMTPEIAKKVVNYFSLKKTKFSDLSNRQSQIVNRIVAGDSYKMIANHLDLSIETIRSYIKNIYKKLNVHSKSEIISKFYKDKL